MLRAAIGFFVLAIVALLFGMGNVAGVSMQIAYLLVGVFVVLAIVSGIAHIFTGNKKIT